MWQVITAYIEDWLIGLDENTLYGIFSAIEVLKNEGPNLKRPLVGEISGSRYGNMKELRPASSGQSEIRILFAFDPHRNAVLLIGGNKAGKWEKWYEEAIRQAEKLYREHLAELEKEE